jgi:hypothetical protein
MRTILWPQPIEIADAAKRKDRNFVLPELRQFCTPSDCPQTQQKLQHCKEFACYRLSKRFLSGRALILGHPEQKGEISHKFGRKQFQPKI